jgi:hypothetical protein
LRGRSVGPFGQQGTKLAAVAEMFFLRGVSVLVKHGIDASKMLWNQIVQSSLLSERNKLYNNTIIFSKGLIIYLDSIIINDS